jgi:hypothetical protein
MDLDVPATRSRAKGPTITASNGPEWYSQRLKSGKNAVGDHLTVSQQVRSIPNSYPSEFESMMGQPSRRQLTSMKSVLFLWLPFVGSYRTMMAVSRDDLLSILGELISDIRCQIRYAQPETRGNQRLHSWQKHQADLLNLDRFIRRVCKLRVHQLTNLKQRFLSIMSLVGIGVCGMPRKRGNI